MALAPYFGKAALAAADILHGVSPAQFEELLAPIAVGVAVDEDVMNNFECQTLSELLVNLLARLYPTLVLVGPSQWADSMTQIALLINPNLEVRGEGPCAAWVCVGDKYVDAGTSVVVNASSGGWVARISEYPMSSGKSDNPLGAAAAACLAAANVLRAVFPEYLVGAALDRNVSLCMFDYKVNDPQCISCHPEIAGSLIEDATLVGAGAIGNGALWALARSPIAGMLNVIDPESVDSTNAQRYVLTECSTQADKVQLAETTMWGSLKVAPFKGTWADFLGAGRHFSLVAIAVDTVDARIEIQAGLPRHILNAWTQTGDLGISRHDFLGDQACLACLYIPLHAKPSEEQLVQQAIRYTGEIMALRNLLYTNDPLDQIWIERIATDMGLNQDLVQPFLERSLRELYQKGICGGLLLPSNFEGAKRTIMVPMAFQSALAGVMLASEMILYSMGESSAPPPVTTKINLLRPLGPHLSEPESKHSRCICHDPDFIEAYKRRFDRL